MGGAIGSVVGSIGGDLLGGPAGGAIGGQLGGALGGSLGGSSTGGAPSNSAVSNFQFPGMGQAATNWGNSSNNNTSNSAYLQSILPQIQQLFGQQMNNPYASQLQQGAGQAGQQLQQVGNTAVNGSGQLSQGASQVLPYAQQVMQMGLDPQSALFNQQQQQTRDQANVTNAQQGITGPYAAGATNQAMQNFDTNWQNQQLQRAISGLGAGSSAVNAAGSGLSTANSLGGAGAQNNYTGAGLPFGAANTITGQQQTALQNLFGNVGGINTSNSQDMTNLLNYLNSGVSAAHGQGQNLISNYPNQLQGSTAQSMGGLNLGNVASQGFNSLFPSFGGSGSSSGGANLTSGLGDILGTF
jgi:hypothetical protein